MSNTNDPIMEGMIVYGKVIDSTILTKEAAINAVKKAKEENKIRDYRVEEETDTTGKIIITLLRGVQIMRPSIKILRGTIDE